MFGNNPFTSGATQNMVQERTEADCKGMVCKSCGDTYGKPTNEKCMYDSKDPNGKNWMTSKNEAMDPVNKAELKGKHKDRKDKDIDNDGFVGPKDKYLHKRRKAISKAMDEDQKEAMVLNPSNSAIKKPVAFASKPRDPKLGPRRPWNSKVNDAGKPYQEGYYKDLEIKKQDKELGARPVLSKKKKPGKNAVMNPKLDSGKSKGSEMEQKEYVNVSHIRQALMSVLEGENHSPNKDKAEKPEDALKGAGAKKMKDDNKDDGRYHDMEKQSHDDAAKAGRAGPGKKARPNDSKDGDKNVINPADDVTKKGQAPKVKTESYDNMAGLKAAYASMYEKTSVPSTTTKVSSTHDKYTHEVDYAEAGAHTAKKFVAHAQKAGIKAKIHTNRGPGGGHPVVHLGHSDEGHVHRFLKKHYDRDLHKDDMEMHRI